MKEKLMAHAGKIMVGLLVTTLLSTAAGIANHIRLTRQIRELKNQGTDNESQGTDNESQGTDNESKETDKESQETGEGSKQE